MVETFKTLYLGVVASGAYSEVRWTPDRDIIIRKGLFNERDDKSLNNVQAYISIADVPYTKDYVSARVVGQTLEYCWKPNLPVPKGATIYVKVVNGRADSINLDVSFVYE